MAGEILTLCRQKGFLLDSEMLTLFSSLSSKTSLEIIEVFSTLPISESMITLNLFKTYIHSYKQLFAPFSSVPELASFYAEEYIDEKTKKSAYTSLTNSPITSPVKFLSTPSFPQKKIVVKDFVTHFRQRYDTMKTFFDSHDFDNLSSIRKIGSTRGSYTIIVSVLQKRMTKNKNLLITVEDLSGTSVVLVNQNKKEVFEKAKDLLADDIVAFSVTGTSDILFANDVYYPEAGLEEKRYSEDDEYIAFISDMHAGSTMFLEKNLISFITWLNGGGETEDQKILASKVKYLIINGDNIDGVNHYPGQEKHLNILTSRGQYKKVEDILKLVRKDITMVMGPGQHDAVWVGEPQPAIGEAYAKGLHELENLYLVPNPCLLEIKGGFKILMYHGGSINRFIDEIPYIRTNYSHRCPTKVVKEILKRRHLAPMHGMMDYIPCENEDPLVIKTIPDIITTGDQHRIEISTYNNILLIATSCWQSITPFEEKVGNVPDPCKVPLFNLKTREIKILDFSDGESKEKKVEEKPTEDYLEYGEMGEIDEDAE